MEKIDMVLLKFLWLGKTFISLNFDFIEFENC